MQPAVLAVLMMVSLIADAAPSGFAAPARKAPPVPSRPCGHGYRCQDVHVQLCVKRPKRGSIWSLTRKDAQLRRGVSVTGCTQYAVGVSFVLQYNGKQAAVPKHSLKCAVQIEHGVSILIEKCYYLLQKSGQNRFKDLITGARVCARSPGARGRGCHDEYAINVYAYADGSLRGETWVGFKIAGPLVRALVG